MLREWAKQMRSRHWTLPRIHKTYGSLSIAETFRRVYQSKAWGSNGEEFCSGAGSGGAAADLYCDAVIDFIRDYHVRSIVDLGCGDFAIGRRIVEATGVQYTGVDVVPELVEHNQRRVQDPRVSFLCADITCAPLPQADLCLIRQVLQHLSNAEISNVLANIVSFPQVLVSEDVPIRPSSFNRDKPHGPDVRAYYGSGVYLDQPPFSKPAKDLWTFSLRDDALLRTVLLGEVARARRG
jgi:SAM-dependent methyltransferase